MLETLLQQMKMQPFKAVSSKKDDHTPIVKKNHDNGKNKPKVKYKHKP